MHRLSEISLPCDRLEKRLKNVTFKTFLAHIGLHHTHIDMLWIIIQQQPFTVLPTLLGSGFGVLGHMLWSKNDVIMTWLRLRTATSNSFPHPYIKSV
jgi:hypothetical protein